MPADTAQEHICCMVSLLKPLVIAQSLVFCIIIELSGRSRPHLKFKFDISE